LVWSGGGVPSVGGGAEVCGLDSCFSAGGCCALAGTALDARKTATAILSHTPFGIKRSSFLSFRVPESKIVGKDARDVKDEGDVKDERKFRREMFAVPHRRKRVARQFCNSTTRNCMFFLDTTSTPAHNPRNLSAFFRSGGLERRQRALRAENSRVISRGEQRAVFAGMDCAMHQPGVRGSRPVVAGHRLRRGTLQQLSLSASQRSAAARPTPAFASAVARQLPPTRPLARTAQVAFACPGPAGVRDPQGRSSRFPPGRAVPAGCASMGCPFCLLFQS